MSESPSPPGSFEFDGNGHLIVGDNDLLIVVDGPFISGKSTFIQTICEDCHYEERGGFEGDQGETNIPDTQNPEAVLDFIQSLRIPIFLGLGRIHVDENLALYLYEPHTPYQYSYLSDEPTNPTLIGIVILVNSEMPETFREARSKIETLKAYSPVPCVVADNPRQYSANTAVWQIPTEGWDVNDLRIALRVQDDMPVVHCNAADKTSVQNVLLALVNRVLEELDE